MKNMLDSVAPGLAVVSLLRESATLYLGVVFALLLIGVLLRVAVNRLGRRNGAPGPAAPWGSWGVSIASRVNTASPSNVVAVGGSHLWPATLVGAPRPTARRRTGAQRRERVGRSWRGQRRRISPRAAATLHHGVDPQRGPR